MLLILLFNISLVNWLGHLLVRTLVFPFSIGLVHNSIDGPSTIKYQKDFMNVLSTVYVILRSLVVPVPKRAATDENSGNGPRRANTLD